MPPGPRSIGLMSVLTVIFAGFAVGSARQSDTTGALIAAGCCAVVAIRAVMLLVALRSRSPTEKNE
jgi:predicted branched-subunit amino acid permease